MNDDDDARSVRRRRSEDADASMAATSHDDSGFARISATAANQNKLETRRVHVPQNRLTSLRNDWLDIYTPIVQHLKLDVRFNMRKRAVELRTNAHTEDVEMLQRAVDFVKAYTLGFSVADALAILRVEDLFVESFMVTDVKMLKGDHLARAIGRIAGKDGKAKATRMRIMKVEFRL